MSNLRTTISKLQRVKAKHLMSITGKEFEVPKELIEDLLADRYGVKSGGAHVIRLYDGGAGCSTCPDTPRAVQLMECDGTYFCARELLVEAEHLRGKVLAANFDASNPAAAMQREWIKELRWNAGTYPLKCEFLAVCAEWADALIADAAKIASYGDPVHRASLQRLNDGAAEWVPRIKYADIDGELIESPEAQAKVWRAGYQLMLDAYDAAHSSEQAKKEENANDATTE